LRAALESRDSDVFGALLADDVRWGGPEDTSETCHSREDVLKRLAGRSAAGVETTLLEVVPGANSMLVGFRVRRPEAGGSRRERTVYQVMTLRGDRIVDIRGYPHPEEAAAEADVALPKEQPRMRVQAVTPILNVSSLTDSFDWFAKLGWIKKLDWSPPGGEPSFGAVACDEFEIFLCLNGQGGRGRDGGVGNGGTGVWLSIWTNDVDAVHGTCLREGLAVVRHPQDETWGVREMHVQHPDGHVLRVSQAIHRH
jgi:ketosteroid isomerase-like protein